MSLLRLNINDVPEPTVVAAGEYEVSIIGVELKPTKSGGRMLNASLSIVGENTPPVFQMMTLPDEANEQYTQMRLLAIKRFCQAFGIDEGDEGFSFDASNHMVGVKGLRARANVGIEESAEFGTKNVIKSWLR